MTFSEPHMLVSLPKYLAPERVKVLGAYTAEFAEILTPSALAFVAELHRRFDRTRRDLLARRVARQKEFAAGKLPDFISETRLIREKPWTVAPLPTDLLDRRVEITGPAERKMIINALNSGAKVFMADLEDSNSPTWANVVGGQINLRDAVRRTISLSTPTKEYRLNEEIATLIVRPRGWHLLEKHVLVDGEPISAALFDFGLYFFHNAHELLARGSGPYFYLPKIESHLEARLWNDVFGIAQWSLKIPKSSIKATVLIETLPASFELNEILYELRDHSAGLNCGRWDYIFSYIKRLGLNPDFRLPDRAQVTMTVPFMAAYSQLVVQTCHRRGVHAIGGMAAQIPIKNDPDANESALEKVRQDKVREAKNGHDGTWVAHPGLVPIALQVFNELMPSANQIERKREDVHVTAADLVQAPQGTITEAGLRLNIDVAIRYLEAWLGGNGCVPLYNLMEDAATAEISRAQMWQWLHTPGTTLEDGRPVTLELYRSLITDQIALMRKAIGEENFTQGHYEQAARLFDRLVTTKEFTEFLTLPAYEQLA
ncbi:malate synthase [Hymenobacter roseosalivarius DSM 11622]|uniref:Malate synthase n=1 Tax=Hymenobacter roseosalivarius DSM 11622 TaxID=645990 RepID=A0A1W1VVI2_9BACT|nr:malate synthase A [Hymenobacter roseosalivarius]SMB97336.1 malate synthase [Hymenobacter roseosalivarius DSM 11622]